MEFWNAGMMGNLITSRFPPGLPAFCRAIFATALKEYQEKGPARTRRSKPAVVGAR